MSKQEPEVLDGLRGPRSLRMDEMRQKDAERTQPAREILIRENATTYQSRFLGYRVQIAVSDDIRDPYTGRNQKGKVVAAQFKEGIFVNDHKDPEIRTLTDTVLQSLAQFGKLKDGKIPAHADFWLASEANAASKVAQLTAAKRTLAALPPEQVRAFMDELALGAAVDHSLPKREIEIAHSEV